ncbi:hypothetical protein LUR56_34615 [Streptomyces sp. MT29]|nr:hypothetical protein [Streptomyces sp. MT29]
MASSLDASATATAWVLTAHALALGVGTALFGRLADTRGVRARCCSARWRSPSAR